MSVAGGFMSRILYFHGSVLLRYWKGLKVYEYSEYEFDPRKKERKKKEKKPKHTQKTKSLKNAKIFLKITKQ